MPLLSIITINFNNASGLQKTIESVVNQNFDDFEYIVIDGGSSDNSKSIIEKYQSKITYWVSEKDSGIYNAQNKGILKSKGEYCLFLNSGDYLCNSDVFKKVFNKESIADIIYGNMQIDYGNGKIEFGKMPPKITFKQMYIDTLWHPVSFIKRSLFQTYGLYNEKYKMVADYDFFFNVIVMKSVSSQYIDMDISVFNMEGVSSLATNKENEQQERKMVIQSYLPPLVIEYAENLKLIMPPKRTVLQRLINKLKG
jgi:glycosyltransferase involved in cell wall biosynthesis